LEEVHLHAGARFEAVEAFANIGKKARLGEFSVGNDVDAALHLLAHHFGDGFAQGILVSLLVVRLPGIFRLHRIEQRMRAWQAADVGRLDAVDVLLELQGAGPRSCAALHVRCIGRRVSCKFRKGDGHV
jgi:hypothetical protein